MVGVVSVGIRIALLSGRTSRWQQQTPLSPLAFATRGRGRSQEGGSDEEMGVDDEKKGAVVGYGREVGVWRVG